MYSVEHNEYFPMAPHPNASHEHWWNQAEPIWITAEKAGIKSALYRWDGCQVNIRGRSASFCIPYNETDVPSWNNETKQSFGKVLDDFKNDKYGLAMVYYEPVDMMGKTSFNLC